MEPEKLILDGQQRLTSLTQVLGLKGPVKTFDHKKAEVERFYYIDIPMVLSGDDIDEAFYSVNAEKTKTSDFGRQIDPRLTTMEKEVEAFQFPCNRISTTTSGRIAVTRRENSKNSRSSGRKSLSRSFTTNIPYHRPQQTHFQRGGLSRL